jgi:hypothetical protein
MPKKKFDCIKMKHDIQKKIIQEMKGLTPKQQHKKIQKDIESDPLFGPLVKKLIKKT